MTTINRISVLHQLDEIFDSLPPTPLSPSLNNINQNNKNNNSSSLSSSTSSTFNLATKRTAPLYQLPSLITAFEKKRNLTLLTSEEKSQLETFSLEQGKDFLVGPEDLMGILVAMGISSNSPRKNSASTSDNNLEKEKEEVVEEEEEGEGEGDQNEMDITTSQTINEGSPTRKPSRPRPLFSPTSDSIGYSTNLQPRKNLLSSISFFAKSHDLVEGNGNGKGKGKGDWEDLNDLVVMAGESYLRVALGGPLGEGFEVEKIVEELQRENRGDGKGLIEVLGRMTYPQIRAVDKSFREKNKISLLDFMKDDKSISDETRFTLEGLIQGPLNWDVELLRQTFLSSESSSSSSPSNENLLIELLISRSPSSISLLRMAYAHRNKQEQEPSRSTKFNTLDSAILEIFKSEIKIRRAFEVALEGKWEDVEIEEAGSVEGNGLREMFLKEDVDQLKVALRKGGNLELVTKILLARSPSHLHSLSVEYAKTTHSTLTSAIKDVFSGSEMLQKILLHTVGNVQSEEFGIGICRDAELLEQALASTEGDIKALTWRLLRLHWDRPRFLLVLSAYQQKYQRTLSSTIDEKSKGSFRDDLKILVESSNLPEPVATLEDVERLAAMNIRSPLLESTTIEEVDENLEEDSRQQHQRTIRISSSAGIGNPRSSLPVPISRNNSMARSNSQPIPESGSGSSYFDGPTSNIGTPRSASIDFNTSTSSISTPSSASSGIPRPYLQGLNSSSSLSFRQRSSPLESLTPKSDSKSQSHINTPSSSSSLSTKTRSRPIAPAKLRRTSDDHGLSRAVGGQQLDEPLSPHSSNGDTSSPGLSRSSMDQFASSRKISGNLNNNNNGTFNRSESMNSELSLSSSTSSTGSISALGGGRGGRRSSSSSLGSVPSSPHSPPFNSNSSIDHTSYQLGNRPISPMGDVGSLSTSSPTSTSMNSFPSFDFTALPPPLEPFISQPPTYFSNSPEKPSPSSSSNTQDQNTLSISSYDLRRNPSTSSTNSTGSGSGSGGIGMYSGEGSGIIGGVRPESMFGVNNNSKGSNVENALLQAHVEELTRRLKEADGRLYSTSSSYEQDHIDLEIRLEEARSELQIKRREDKELKANEKQHLAQISSLENEITKLSKSLEKSREQFEGMKKNYLDQCVESEKLRGMVTEVRTEIRTAEEAAQHDDIQLQQSERDRENLQATINKLEEDLAVARQAQEQLDDQKAENLLLNETIDRLRFDMEELRSSTRKSLIFDHSGASTSHNRADGSIGNLGNELARRLAQTEAEEAASDGEDDNEEELDDITVTTHRIVKKRVPRGDKSKKSNTNIVEEKITMVLDANTQTDRIETAKMDIQTDVIAVTSELITPSKEVVSEVIKSNRELQQDLAKGLGIDLSRLDQFIENDQIPLAGKPILIETVASSNGLTSRRAPRWTSRMSSRIPNPATAPAYFVNAFPNSAKPYVIQIMESTTSFLMYTLLVYMSGIITGSMFLPSNHHHTMAPLHVLIGASDQAAWHKYNNLGGVWGEGIATTVSGGSVGSSLRWWLTELVWGGVSVVRKYPV